jgi:ABC-2 type transport system permease protein
VSDLALTPYYLTEVKERPRGTTTLSNASVMAERCLRLSRRNVEGLITGLLLPVLLMLVFVYLFGGAIHTGTAYVSYVAPGIVILCAGFGASQAAVGVSQDMAGGIIDRFRSLDVSGPSLLAGHVVASVVRNALSTLLVVGIAFLIGFRSHAGPLDWLAAIGLVLLFVLALSWVAAAAGLVARSPESVSALMFLTMFLTYASSALVPVATMATWVRGFAEHQPITAIIDTLRGLLLGTPVGSDGWEAVLWCSGILVVAVASTGVLFRERTS